MTTTQGDDTQQRFVGRWAMRSVPVKMAYNSRGRVRVDMGGGRVCVGDYEVRGDVLATTYDPGQRGCVSATIPFAFDDDGETLKFGGFVAYERLDREDDLSF